MTIPTVRWTAPLSPGQERLIEAEYDHAAGGDDSRRRLRPLDTGAILVEGEFAPAAMRRAVAALVARQEALRTTFRFRRDAPPVQIVEREGSVNVPLHEQPDGAGVPMHGLPHLLDAAPLRPEGRLFDVHLVRLSPTRHVVVLRIHHLISDGWSIGVLYRELSVLYAAECERGAARLPPLDRPFRDHCVWMHRQRASGGFRDELEYWQAELATTPPRIVFSGSAAPPPVSAVDDEPLHYDAELIGRLRAAARATGGHGGIAAPMLTALAAVVHARSQVEDIRIGLMIAGRTHAHDEHVIGNFVNITVIRIRFDPRWPLQALLTDVSGKLTAAMDHQRVPIQDVARVVPPEPETGRLYQVTLALNTMRSASLDLPGARCTDFGVSPSGEQRGPRFAASKIDARWLFVTAEDGMKGTFTYRMDEFDKPAARLCIAGLSRALTALGDRRDIPAGEAVADA